MFPLDPSTQIVVIGEVFVDVAVEAQLVRLGGIFHAARALDASKVPYSLAYIAPEYLSTAILDYAQKLGAQEAVGIGTTVGGPAVLLAYDLTEAGQRSNYELLRDSKTSTFDPSTLGNLLSKFRPTDILIFPGRYPVEEIVRLSHASGARVHIDAQYDADPVALAAAVRAPFHTVFFSKSAQVPARQIDRWSTDLLSRTANVVVWKENRGGSRAIMADNRTIAAPAFPTRTVHSIGVGDCFDCIWIAGHESENSVERLTRASYYASLYASTLHHEEFCREVQGAASMDAMILSARGVRIPWETRQKYTIYIAAPDFPNVDISPLDMLCSALAYHNFRGYRPIQENGLYTAETAPGEALRIYNSDRGALERAAVVVAVPLTSDPGTFAELGYAAAAGIPSILWDVKRVPENLFAWRCASRVCMTIAEVIDAIFELLRPDDEIQ